MRKKALKALAQKIATQEKILKETTDKQKIHSAQNEIIMLTNQVENIEDLFTLDEMLQEILEKN